MTVLSVNNRLAGGDSPPGEPMRALIAEENSLGCQLLRDVLKRSRLGLGHIYCAVTSSQIVHLAAENEIDVALINEDLQDGASTGLAVVERLRTSQPAIRSIVLVKSISRELILDAFRHGAKGVFCRREPIEALGECIRAVYKGQIWVDAEQLKVILEALLEVNPTRLTNLQGTRLLTKREDEVAGLVAEGLTNREVGERLGLSEHTVGNYVFKIYEKLGLSRRVEFALYFNQKQRNQAES